MSPPRVLILKADLLAAAALHDRLALSDVSRQFSVVHRLQDAKTVLSQGDVGLFITGLSIPDGDVLDLLTSLSAHGMTPRVLVATRFKQPRLLASLRLLSLGGVFDTAGERPDKIVDAVRAIEAGEYYWSESLHNRLLGLPGRAILTQLSPSEQLALALLGDGCADKIAAERLGVTLSSVRCIRRELHRKLGAHDRADLIRLALQHGYVRSTPDGLAPMGLDILRRESSFRKRRIIHSSRASVHQSAIEKGSEGADRGGRHEFSSDELSEADQGSGTELESVVRTHGYLATPRF